ncbi:hypothetical protein IPF37_03170 [bacterium]|nr:MAG: hypothetical protein IPF37_03170 [bacterium]
MLKYKKYLSFVLLSSLLDFSAPTQTLVAAAKKEEKKKVEQKKQAPKLKQKKEVKKKSPQQIAYEQWEASQAEKKKLAEQAVAQNSQSSSSKQEIPAKVAVPVKLEIPQEQEPKLEQKQEVKQIPAIIPKQPAIPPLVPAVNKDSIDIAFAAGDVATLKNLGIRDSMLRLRMHYPIPGRKLDDNAIKEIEAITGYTFQNKNLLIQALTSRTQNPKKNYEALEYLGDKILDATIAEMLLKNYPKADEGQLTGMRQALVSQEPMAALCVKLGLHNYVQHTEKKVPISTLCDIIESIIGAMHKDGAAEATQSFTLKFFLPMIKGRQPKMMDTIIGKAKNKLKIDVSYDATSFYLCNINKHKKGSKKINPRVNQSSGDKKTDPMRLACYLAEREFIETQLSKQYRKKLVRLAIDDDYQPLDAKSLPQQQTIKEKQQSNTTSSETNSNEDDVSSNGISESNVDSSQDSELASNIDSNSESCSEFSPQIKPIIPEIPSEEEFQLKQTKSAHIENSTDIEFIQSNVEQLTNLFKDLGISNSMLHLRMQYSTKTKSLDQCTIKKIEAILGYTFQNKDLLTQALSSPEKSPAKNYVELKILGETILNTIITKMLSENYKDADKEKLTTMYQILVSQESLAALNIRLGLQKYIQHHKSVISISILSDIIESLVGAIYEDSNFNETQSFVLKFFLPMIHDRYPLTPNQIMQLAEDELGINAIYDYAASYLPKLNAYLVTFQYRINSDQADTKTKNNSLSLAHYLAERDFIETLLPSWCKKHLVRLATDPDYQPTNKAFSEDICEKLSALNLG